MKIIPSLLVVLLLNIFCFAQERDDPQPRLIIDSQGHSGVVTDLQFSPDGKTLISVSLDKTIRLWDIQSGTLSRTIRTSIGDGPNGSIYTAALSPDGRHLALGGYFPQNEIRIIDLHRDGKLLILKGHENVINKLAFSNNGKFLASASSDKSVKVWDLTYVEGRIFGKLSKDYQDHEEKVDDLAFSPDNKKLVSASSDGSLILRELNESEAPVIMKMHVDRVFSCAFSPDGTYIASGGSDGQVIAWNSDGTFKTMLARTNSAVYDLNFSSDGLLFAASKKTKILSMPGGTTVGEIPGGTSNISAAALYKDKYYAMAISSAGLIKVMDIKNRRTMAELAGQGLTPQQVAVNGNGAIALSDKQRALDLAFDLENFKFQFGNFDKNRFEGGITEADGYTLTKMDDYTLSTGFKGVVKNDPGLDGRVRRYTIIDDDRIAVGSDFSLKIYSRDGEFIRELKGLEGAVTSMAMNYKYNYLVTSSADQITRLWNIETGKMVVSFYFTNKNDWICWTPSGYYEASAGGEKFLGWHVNKQIDELPEFYPTSVYARHFHKAAVVKNTLRLGNENQAINYLEESEEIPQLAPINVVNDAPTIEWLSPKLIISEAREPKVLLKARIKSSSEIKSVKILINGRPAPQSRGSNGIKQAEAAMIVEQEILLLNEINKIRIFVSNENARKVSEERIVNVDKTKLSKAQNASSSQLIDYTAKPNLFVLGIGISDYANTSYNLTYADDDAESITKLFGTVGRQAYQSVKVEKITNAEATKQNVVSAFRRLKQNANYNDVVIVFVASHGFNENNDFYILPHDGDAEQLETTAINWSIISNTLGSIPAKVLLIIDACHSGQLGMDLAQGSNNTEAVREVSNEENGVVIMAASTGDETSKEFAEWGHGAFTLSLLEGLEMGKANIKDDLTIFLRELDFYVSERTLELTSGQQHPTTQKPSSISRFPILNIDN